MSVESSKPSRLAIFSIILPLLILLMWCIYVVSFGALASQANSPDNEYSGYALLFLGAPLAGVVTVILSLAGMILGVIGIRKNDARKNLAIAGLVINLLCLLPYLLLLALLLFSATGSSS